MTDVRAINALGYFMTVVCFGALLTAGISVGIYGADAEILVRIYYNWQAPLFFGVLGFLLSIED